MDFSSIFKLAGTGLNLALNASAFDNEVAGFHEKQRREQRGFDRLQAEVTARGGAASGLSGSSVSLQNYLSSMTAEFERQKEWSEADFRAAQDAKSLGLFMETASSIGSSVMGMFGIGKDKKGNTVGMGMGDWTDSARTGLSISRLFQEGDE